MKFVRTILRRLMPSEACRNLDRAAAHLQAAAMKIEEAPHEVKARTGRIFIEAAGAPVSPRISPTTA